MLSSLPSSLPSPLLSSCSPSFSVHIIIMHNADDVVVVVFSRAVIQTKRSDSTNKSDHGRIKFLLGPICCDVYHHDLRKNFQALNLFGQITQKRKNMMRIPKANMTLWTLRMEGPPPSSQRTAPEEVSRRGVLDDCQEVQ